MAFFLLKEKIKIIHWLFLTISLIGVLIIKGFGLNIDLTGFLYALFSAIFLGFALVVTNKIGKTEDPLVIVSYFMFVTLLFGGIMSFNNWVNPSFSELILLLGSGGLGFFGLIYLTKSLQNYEVKNVVPLKYLEVLISIIIGIIWFDEIYTIWSLIGVLLIMLGISYNIFFKNKL